MPLNSFLLFSFYEPFYWNKAFTVLSETEGVIGHTKGNKLKIYSSAFVPQFTDIFSQFVIPSSSLHFSLHPFIIVSRN